MADTFDLHEWNKKRYLNEGIDLSPLQADKIHKFITSQLRKAVMDYNESLEDDDKQIRMSFFEQEFPLSSTFYNALTQALNENIDEEAGPRQKTTNLENLTWELLLSIMGKVPMFGFHLPNPDDSHRMANNEDAFEDWKKGVMEKYGNVNVRIDSEASFPFERIKILDDKFLADKKRSISNKAAWLDKEREAGRSIDEIEEGIDTITTDVPLFIRLMEYAREDAENDIDLHDVAENIIRLSNKSEEPLTMDDYNNIVNQQEELNPLKETVKFIMEDLEGYSDYFPGGKTKGLTPKTLSTILTNIAKDISYDGEELDESTLCKRGQDYIKARKAAGEKSSAYLSGRAVKVCKGQIKFKGKKQKDFKG
jgi:hypothetical protein